VLTGTTDADETLGHELAFSGGGQTF
jgi:hypothetical protein